MINTKGIEESDYVDITETSEALGDLKIDKECGTFWTEMGEINGFQTVAILNDQSAFHGITKEDIFVDQQAQIPPSSVFTCDRYSSAVFHGIIPDTGAAGVSTAGHPQVEALMKILSEVTINTATAGQHQIRFGKGLAITIGTICVNTLLGPITFYVVLANTPFLYCIQDMDRMGVKLDNLKNVLIQGQKVVPVVRKWGHPWMLPHSMEKAIAVSHLTETELKQLHRRFGHLSVQRLTRILQRAGQEFDSKALQHLTKFCHHCQMNGKSPGRFKFNLKHDYEFNYSIIVDVLYLDGKPVLQVINSSTNFGASKFLPNMSASTTWDVLRYCWIDAYQGPPDQIVHDAGKNFASAEFRQLAKAMSIRLKEVPVELHNSVGLVERYHAPLRRAYSIIKEELKGEKVSNDIILQMAQKAVNDSAGPDGIVPTLLVLGAYPRMSSLDHPAPSVIKRAEAIRLATQELCKI